MNYLHRYSLLFTSQNKNLENYKPDTAAFLFIYFFFSFAVLDVAHKDAVDGK